MKEELKLIKDGNNWVYNNIEDDLQEVYNHFRSLSNDNERLRIENEYLKSEHYKDQELSKLKDQVKALKDSAMRGFSISEEEYKRISTWKKEILEKYPANSGAIGGRFVYTFTPTGIGTIGTIKDTFSNEKFTFKDLSNA